MNYLLDVVNEIAGYSEKHYEETMERINHEGLIHKYRSEKERCQEEDVPLSESPLMGDQHPHCVLVIEAIHELLDMPDANYQYGSRQHSKMMTGNLAKDYIDELLIRMLPGNDNWYRSHFPVILETNKSHWAGAQVAD